ncbi:MAG: acyl-CoA-binding protein [Anaerolineae bacterium]|nr:acyl-CoA-binding protein [Anaerolineae bacterium]
MSDLQARFETAAKEALELPKRPDNQTLLRLYALYKQATVGNAPAERPEALDFVGRAKHDAWARLQGTTKEEAMQAYIDLVESLK